MITPTQPRLRAAVTVIAAPPSFSSRCSTFAGASTVARAERYVVAMQVTILLVFVVVGVFGVSTARLSPDQWSPRLSLVAGGMIVFLAYEGFELIAAKKTTRGRTLRGDRMTTGTRSASLGM